MSSQRTEEINHIMLRILEVPYLDTDEEQMLSLKLLEWAKEHEDIYAQVYGLTYLGDSLIAHNEMEKAGIHLKDAEALLNEGDGTEEILVRLYSLLGIYYEWKTDEQNAVQYYLEALAVARKMKNVLSECIVLNNLAHIFECHNCNSSAMDYLQMAYKLQKQAEELPIRSIILCNLADLYLKIDNKEEAWRCYQECEDAEPNLHIREEYKRRNRCCYYGAAGEKDKARYWAQLALEEAGQQEMEQFESFENYNRLCQSMLAVKEDVLAKQFIDLMEKSSTGSLEQYSALRDKKFQYRILIGNEAEKNKAYHSYYQETKELKENINKAIAESMKDKISLAQMIRQKKEMMAEKDELELQANIDELTELYNRRYLEFMIQESTQTGIGKCYGVIMLDVDFFKEYNDYYGHLEGDAVLHNVAVILKKRQAKGIKACRYGGDEFICLCVGTSDEIIESYIKEVQKDIYNSCMTHKKSLCSDRITLSIGYVNQTLTEKNGIYNLLQLADKALYESKQAGRNTYRRK